MLLSRVAWRDFRNIGQATIEPDPGLNVLWGDNAQGKTNLLEGIHLLGNLKSFRQGPNEAIVRHGSERATVGAELSFRGVQRSIDLTIDGRGKTTRVDRKTVRTAKDFLGVLKTVLFSPEEVNLVKGYPGGRRSLVDRAVFQIDPSFLERAQDYSRCLKQRNRLLKNGCSQAELDSWTEELVRTGARIRQDRYLYLAGLRPLLEEAYLNLTGNKERANLLYPAGNDDEQALCETLKRRLERDSERERQLRQTLSGPHRDDFDFMVNGLSLRLYGSQGQQRSFMLAFKTAQIMDLEAKLGEAPVLLLDDMTGELDRQRQGFFFRFLLGRRGQVFVTTTDIQPLLNEGLDHARFFRVVGGSLETE
ncbi:MAG: DNA replication and repair protein RecF [Desulfuromonas sp.]|uniref:DNA replication/repair protein RecF n=1 Tax=Desulfuromonas sp. TaxID=892 RepID=UPI000CADA933|nr:DNA replication/repair protein RecF [Desulfuromonas sp.]PLX83314.1 MAG: DNA replication and repair protein RecF [Desulfuromonas sp.]